MFKKNIASILCMLFIIALCFVSCDEKPLTGSLNINFKDTISRTPIEPNISLEIKSYKVSVKGPVEIKDEVIDKDGTYSKTSLPVGEYIVTVTALNGKGTEIGHGSSTFGLKDGESKNIEITVRELEGYGKLTVTLDGSVLTSETYTLTIYDSEKMVGSPIEFKANNKNELVASTTLPNGFYSFTVSYGNTEYYSEAFRIVKDDSIGAVATIASDSSITITITTEIKENPNLILSVSGTCETHNPLSFIVKGALGGDVTYTWLINNKKVGETTDQIYRYIIYEVGTYNVKCIVNDKTNKSVWSVEKDINVAFSSSMAQSISDSTLEIYKMLKKVLDNTDVQALAITNGNTTEYNFSNNLIKSYARYNDTYFDGKITVTTDINGIKTLNVENLKITYVNNSITDYCTYNGTLIIEKDEKLATKVTLNNFDYAEITKDQINPNVNHAVTGTLYQDFYVGDYEFKFGTSFKGTFNGESYDFEILNPMSFGVYSFSDSIFTPIDTIATTFAMPYYLTQEGKTQEDKNGNIAITAIENKVNIGSVSNSQTVYTKGDFNYSFEKTDSISSYTLVLTDFNYNSDNTKLNDQTLSGKIEVSQNLNSNEFTITFTNYDYSNNKGYKFTVNGVLKCIKDKYGMGYETIYFNGTYNGKKYNHTW